MGGMTLSRDLAITLFAITSACGGQSAPPAVAATPAPSGSTTTVAPDSPATSATSTSPADTSAPASTTPLAAPKCVGQGKACTVGDTYCCYGSCRVYQGSATPVCAP